MPKTSAGLLMYRSRGDRLEVLLVHPGGPLFRNKDDGFWSIPKGGFDADEEPLTAACREFEEETGLKPTGPFRPLGQVRQRSGKLVHAWAFAGDCDPADVQSNAFSMEWPPRSGRRQQFPEIDRAAFFDLEHARRKMNPAQTAFLDALVQPDQD